MEAMSGRYSTGSSTYRKSISPKKQSNVGSGESYEVLGNGEIDFNLLDYKQPTDFIQKCLSFQNERSLLEQMASQLKISRSLLKLSTILTNDATNNSETIHNIIDCAQVFLDAEKIVFAPIDPAMNLVITPLVLATQHSTEVLRVSSGIEYDTLQSRRGGIIINEVMNDTRVNLDIYRSLNVIPRNLICYPVIHPNSSPVGLLLVINKLSVNSTFTSSDLWCLEYISSYIATAHLLKKQQHQSPPTVAADKNQHFPRYDNLSLSLQTQQQHPQQHQPSFVSNFSSAAATVAISPSSLSKSTYPKSQQMSTIELCIEQLINNAYHILRADKISLFLPHENSHQLICTISRDIKGMQVSMDEGVVGQTLKSKSPIHSSNVRENIHHSNSMDTLTGYQTVSLLSYPILAKNGTQVLGVLQAMNKEGADDFSAEDNLYFSNLSTYISELLSNKGEDHVESMNLNIITAIGDYSYSSAYSYRTHIYDHLTDFNENRVLELISYCKLICSTNHVLMYALQHSSDASGASTSVPLTTQFENEIMAESANVGLELKYLSSLSAQEDSSSIANPSSGDYGSVYSMPSYRNKSIPSSVLRAIQQNRIIQITRRAHHMTPPPQESQGQGPARGQQEDSESDENYLQSVNSTAAIIIPLHLASSASASSLSFSGRASESPLDVLIILKTITSPSSLSSSSPAHPAPVPSKDTLPSFSYLFNLSLNDFTAYQSHGIHCLLKIFRCTYQLSLTHREELFQQSILENKVQIMNDSLVQLDTMYCLLSGEGLLKLYNPSFEKFLGVPQTTLDSLSKSNDNSSLFQSYPSSGVGPSHDEEYKLMDLSLDSLLPSTSSALVQSLHEAIRSGNMTRGQDVLLKTFRHPQGVRVNYEIYEYYGHHSATSASAGAPVSAKKRVRKSLTRLDSFHFDNSSSPLQERRFTGRTGKLYRICLKYSNNIEQQDKEQQQQLQQEVIQSNSRLINEFPSVACVGDDSNCNLAILLDQSEEMDSFVLQTKNSLLPSTPQKRSFHGGGSPMTTPRSPRGSGSGGFLSPSSSSKLSQLSLLYSWDFNSLEVPSADHQKQYALLLLEKNVNITELNIPKAFFYSLISDIESNYYANPFHNFQHALCVLQFLFMLLENTNFPAPAVASAAASASRVSLLPQLSDRKKRRSNPREKKIDLEQGQGEGQGDSSSYHHLIPHDHLYLTVLLSALFHDIRHPGNTNLFEINSHSSKALLYNDQSVLENYHCSTAFHLLNLPKNNIFLHYSFADKALIRKLIISCVLATDMSQHNHLIHQIQDKSRAYSSEISRGDYVSIMKTREEEMIFYGKILLHCADLSNPVRPFPISKQWAELVSEEFNEQGKKESFLQLPVSSFLLSPTLEALVKNEIFFSNEVVLPLWKSMELYFPAVPKFRAFVQQIHQNTALWKLLVNDNNSSATAPSASLSGSASASASPGPSVSLSSPAHSSANASSES